MNWNSMIGIIGGSGFYNFLKNPDKIEVNTVFGNTTIHTGMVSDKKVGFIPRHGGEHTITPSDINYRANIMGARELGITEIIASNALGSLNKEIPPGSLVVPDQILDFTSSREDSFFDGGDFEYLHTNGKMLSGVVHTDVTQPFDQKIRERIMKSMKKSNTTAIDGGTIVVTNGPRYETPAEIKAFRILGADYAGMTSAPEAFLARELGIKYATLGVITNYAAGMQKSISHEEVDRLFKQKIELIRQIFTDIIVSSD